MSAPQWLTNGYSNVGASFSVYGKTLMAVWKGPGNDTRLWWSQTTFSAWEGWTGAQWSAPALFSGPNFASSLAPCLTDAVTYADGSSGIAMVWRGAQDNSIWYAYYDGKNWGPAAQVPAAASEAAPTATYYQTSLMVSWRGVGTDQSIYWSVLPPARSGLLHMLPTWTTPAKVPDVGGSSDSPALAAAASAAYLFWKGLGTDPRIFYATYNGTTWTAPQMVDGVGTSVGPVARAAFLGPVATDTIWLAWKGKDTDTRVFYSSLGSNKQWSPQQPLAVAATNSRPALAAYDDVMFTGWSDAAGSGIFWGALLGISAPAPAAPVASRTFSPAPWTTPGINSLGGSVILTVRSDGTWSATFNTTNGAGVSGYTFQIRAYLIGPNLPVMLFSNSGSIGQNVFHSVSESYTETGTNPLIALYWQQIMASGTQFQIAPPDFHFSGVVGFLDKVVSDLLSLAVGAVGGAIGVVLGLTKDAIGALNLNLGPGVTIGVVAGVAVFVIGALVGLPLGAAVFAGTVAGVATGAVASALITSRPMTADEIAMAQQVFKGELNYSNVMFTNLSLFSGRSVTAPGVDGKAYCNFGASYAADMSKKTNGAYPVPGELMIHELTHAWQIQHNSFIPGFVCSGMVNQANYKFGDNIYRYGPPGAPWSSLNLEQQASIVNEWFAGSGDGPYPGYPAPQSSFPGMDLNDPYYMYIQGNILTGSAGYSTSVFSDEPGISNP